MSPLRSALFLILTTIAAFAATAATAAPKELYGKSIVVTWSEDREQRLAGQTEFRSRNFAGKLSIYVSTEGHVFNRKTMSTPQGGRGLKSTRTEEGSAERVGGGGNGSASFQGHSMTAVAAAQHGAQLIRVTFDQAFSSCSAEVVRGKEQGAETMVSKSMIRPGNEVEIRSSHTSGVSCAIQNGNVFAQ